MERLANNLEKHRKIFIFCALVISFIILFFAVYTTDFYYDDFAYMNNLVTQQKITSIQEILPSVVEHYFTWGGRAITVYILQLLLFCGRGTIACFVALVYLTIAILCSKLCDKDRKINLISLLFFVSLFYFFNPDWYETVLWTSGMTVYLIPTLFMVVFVYLFTSKRNRPWYYIIAMLLSGFLCGWSVEHVAPATFCAMAFYEFVTYKKAHKIEVSNIVGLVALLIGGALLILAPGNFVRLNDYSTHPLWYSIILRIWEQILRNFKDGFVPIAFLYISVILTRKVSKLSLSLIILGHLATFAMFATELFPLRAFQPIVFIFLTATCMNFANSDIYDKYQNKLNLIVFYGYAGFILSNLYYIAYQFIH